YNWLKYHRWRENMSSKVKTTYLLVDRKTLPSSNTGKESIETLKRKIKSLLHDKIHGISQPLYRQSESGAVRLDLARADRAQVGRDPTACPMDPHLFPALWGTRRLP
ncbi:MAG: hypothetical protein MZW92_33675, partial [Comamonadaceae bacterium]|nr:hypothetical protein [Comamonadaceae bacterium]